MCKKVGSNQIKTAKLVDLVCYLEDKHPELIAYDSKSKRHVHSEHDSCIIVGRGFYRFSNGQRGDQIQFLEDFCDMTFQDAVEELHKYAICNDENLLSKSEDEPEDNREFIPPKPLAGKYKNVWAYLVYKRGIPKEFVEELFANKKLYQANDYNNAVFIGNNYAEIVGTTDIKFKHILPGSSSDGYWSIGDDEAEKVYVCESAIDAISLYVLIKKHIPDVNVACASMGGLKDKAVATLKNKYKTVILAVDNDERAKEYLKKYPDDLKILPPEIKGVKDWNDLLRYCDDLDKIIYALKDEFLDNSVPF